jgi:hypothetical protein
LLTGVAALIAAELIGYDLGYFRFPVTSTWVSAQTR